MYLSHEHRGMTREGAGTRYAGSWVHVDVQ